MKKRDRWFARNRPVLSRVLLVVICGNAHGEQNRATQTPAQSDWFPPVRISVDSTQFPRYPIVVNSANRLTVLYQSFVKRTGQLAQPGRILAIELRRGKSTPPENVSGPSTHAARARATIDSRGVVHVMFGIPSNPRGNEPGPVTLNELHYVKRVNDHWSKTIRIFHSPDALIDIESPIVDHAGNAHLVWSIRQSGRSSPDASSIFYRAHDEGSSAPPVQIGKGVYPSLAMSKSGILFLAYFATSGGPTRHEIRVLRSSTGGKEWQQIARLPIARGYVSIGNRLRISPDNSIHLIWGLDLTGDGVADAFQHATSNEGAQWSSPRFLFLPEGGISFDFTAEFDSKSRLHVVFDRSRGFVAKPRQAQESVWISGTWTQPKNILGLNGVSEGINLSRSVDGSLLVAAYASDAPGGAGIVMAHSR